jgi:RHS repeat-associated protein
VSTFIYAEEPNTPSYMVRSGTTYRIVSDQLGSVRAVVDAQTGATVQRLEYDDYGAVLADTNPGFQPFGFAGGMYDHATGLVRFGARDYDAFMGRWTARDPILFDGGTANLYQYVHGDPINSVDPTGLFDVFFGYEVDAVGINGFEFGGGLVLDFDNFGDSGFYVNGGPGSGANFGYGLGGGFALREIEGWGTDVDISGGVASPVFLFDDQGFNGLAAGVGPGKGVSFSATFTETYSINDAANWLTSDWGWQ